MFVSIVGGGIGALALALMLHERGIQCRVFEASPAPLKSGAGIELLPNAVAELEALGLRPSLERIGVPTERLIFKTSQGLDILARPVKGDHFAVHRNDLHAALHAAVQMRLGPDSIRYDHHFLGVDLTDRGLVAEFQFSSGAMRAEAFDVLIGADGLNSALRRDLFPEEGEPHWDGVVTWRGTALAPAIRGGATKIIAGSTELQFTATPVAERSNDTRLTSWTLSATLGQTAMGPVDWSQRAGAEDILPMISGQFFLPEVDVADMIRSSEQIFVHPMCDREPLPRWSYGCVTLLGDAAHPLAPKELHGATQAILDARALADNLAEGGDPEESLEAYDAARRPLTSAIHAASRDGRMSRVIDFIEARAPGGFHDVHDVVDPTELHALLGDYTSLPASALNDHA